MAASLILNLFAYTAPLSPQGAASAIRAVRMAETGKFSAAVPFLSQPEKLTGEMVGDCGFVRALHCFPRRALCSSQLSPPAPARAGLFHRSPCPFPFKGPDRLVQD